MFVSHTIIKRSLLIFNSDGKDFQCSLLEMIFRMLRAYLRKIPGLPLERQFHMADAAGVLADVRYIEARGDITVVRDEALKSLRPNDTLWVADLAVIADSRKGLLGFLETLNKVVEVAIFEGRSGRVSSAPHDGQHMVLEATARWAARNKTFGTLTAAEAGMAGAKQATKTKRKGRAPKDLVAKIWHDKSRLHMNTDEITAAVNAFARAQGFCTEWSTTSLYRALGPRGAAAGRKAKHD